MSRPIQTWRDLEALVKAFEAADIPREAWTHREHLALTAWYVLQNPLNATDRMRRGIQRLNAANGIETTLTGGYHETLTVSWVRLIRHHISELDGLPPIDRVNAVLEAFADKTQMLRYYSRELILAPKARFGWVEPDLQPLPELN